MALYAKESGAAWSGGSQRCPSVNPFTYPLTDSPNRPISAAIAFVPRS